MNTTNKKTCAFMLDRDVAAAIERAALLHRISKSSYVNSLLVAALVGAGLMDIERKALPKKKGGRQPKAISADMPATAAKPKRKRAG